jgi:hypothetical protein
MSRASIGLSLLALVVAACVAPSPQAPLTVPLPAENPHSPPVDRPAGSRAPFVGPHGEVAGLMGHRVQIVSPSGDEETVEPSELHPPSGVRALRGIEPTALLFLDDGALLVGMADGTVTALTTPPESRRRRWSLGFRGAIRGLVSLGDGLVAVSTQRGDLALLTAEGRLRWERHLTAEHLSRAVITPDRTLLVASERGVFALSLDGQLLFSHASSRLRPPCAERDPDCTQGAPALSFDGSEVVAGSGLRFRLDADHPAVPSLEPIFPLTFHKERDENITSLVAGLPREVLALVCTRTLDEFSEVLRQGCAVLRVSGSRTTRVAVPAKAARSEIFLEGTKPAQAPFVVDALVPGPGPDPWILARRLCWEKIGCESGSCGTPVSAGQILELRGSKIQERRDLFEAFAGHAIVKPTAAAPVGPTGLVCFADTCAAGEGSSVRLLPVPDGEMVVSVGRVEGREWVVGKGGGVFRRQGDSLVPVPSYKGIRAVAGAGERDVWADFNQPYFALHFDGAAWTEVPVPAASLDGLVARAPDDVWSGSVHWDGKRWSRIFGAPRAAGMVVRARDDVWTGGDGLWHGTAPGPVPVRLPPAPPDEGAIPAPPALPLGAPETGYTVERTSFPVAGAEPLKAARSVSASPDGVLWVQSWDRLLEVDETGKATKLRRGKDAFGRWAHPEAKGRGVTLLERGELQRLDGDRSIRDDVQLDSHVALSVHGDGNGVAWVVGSSADFSAQALVRAAAGPFQPVLGLPSAAWIDVAAAPDGGAWFAGALNAGPEGEGILFHARGRLGSLATARFRAPASLLAVAAFGPDEAWAVGAAGAVIHVTGGAVTRYTLPSGEWLRAVAGTSPADVWIGGDGGTLLHYDGRAFHPVAHPLGGHAALTGVASARGSLWAVGPSGILRITKRP